MKDVKRVTYIKRGGKWTDAYIDDDPIDVYKDLISCFESKFLLGSKSIGRITRNNNIDRMFDRLAKETEVLNLPTVKELKAWIKEKHIRRNNPGKTTFCIDGFVHVNPFFLLDMIQGLPNCTAYRPEKRTSPIYFQSESGEGILCPVYVPAY